MGTVSMFALTMVLSWSSASATMFRRGPIKFVRCNWDKFDRANDRFYCQQLYSHDVHGDIAGSLDKKNGS